MILIGLDGVDIQTFQYILSLGDFPALEKVFQGYKTQLMSTIPPMSPTAWTSILTGVKPEKHRIFGFTKVNKQNECKETINTSQNVENPRLYEIASLLDLKSLVINVPYSTPFTSFKGVGIPDWLSFSREVHDRGVNDKISKVAQQFKTLDQENGPLWHFLPKNQLLMNIKETLRQKISFYNKLIKFEDWNFIINVFSEPDWFFHKIYHELRNESVKSHLRDIFSLIDFHVAKLLEKYKQSLFVMVSDHGFKTYNKVVYPNKVLHDLRLFKRNLLGVIETLFYRIFGRELKVDIPLSKPLTSLMKRVSLDKLVAEIDVGVEKKETLAFVSNTGSFCGIHINPDVIPENVSYEKIVSLLLFSFRQLKDPRTQKRLFPLVEKKEDFFDKPVDDSAPDIIFLPNMKEGYWFSPEISTSVLESQYKNDHAMLGMGLFYNGRKINQKTLNTYSCLDVVPTILHLLNYPIPTKTDGQVIREVAKRFNIDFPLKKKNYTLRWRLKYRIAQ